MNKLLCNFAIFLVFSYAMLFLIKVWSDMLSAELFFKLSITYLVISVVLVMFYLIFRELADEDKMKKDKYLD